ncbi:MAG: recF [Thermoleophilia bacterium]|nr:recF [Thermoleophilia bacterium]
MSDTAGHAARLTRLTLVDVRSYARLTVEPGRELTVLTGPNGVGKTNLLEACAVAATGASPRTSSELRLVREGAAACRIHAVVEVAEHRHEREVRIEAGRGKQLRIDDSVVRSVEAYAEQVPALTFLPERLLIIRGAPARRRALVDQLTARLMPTFAGELKAYTAALQQRNNLLRRARGGARIDDQLPPWDALLAQHGVEVRRLRRLLLERVAEPFARRLEQLTELTGGTFELAPRGSDDVAAELAASAQHERRRGSTTVGPHLDDILPRQAGRDLRAQGSTGEQRAALLAFTLAARDLVQAATGVLPLLLLDEPWGELDADRRRRLSDLLEDGGQVIATTTEPPAHLVEAARAGRDVAFIAISSGEAHRWHAGDPTTS